MLRYLCVPLLVAYKDVLYYVLLSSAYGLARLCVVGFWLSQLLGQGFLSISFVCDSGCILDLS